MCTDLLVCVFLDYGAGTNLSMDLDAEDALSHRVAAPPTPVLRPPPHSPNLSQPVNMPHVPTHVPEAFPTVPNHALHVMPTVPNHALHVMPTVPNHAPIIVSPKAKTLPPTFSQAQQKAGKLLVAALKKNGNTKPKISRAGGVSKSKHQRETKGSPRHNTTSPNHQVHRTTGAVTLYSPSANANAQKSSGNPNDGQIVELPKENEALAQLMNPKFSREKKRKPWSQNCGDQENPEFSHARRYNVSEAEEGETPDYDPYL